MVICHGHTHTNTQVLEYSEPLISTRSMSSNDNIMSMENCAVIREQNILCNVFNDYFVNIAKDININDPNTSDDTVELIISQYIHHSSIEIIKQNYKYEMSEFNFKSVAFDYILCLLNKLNAWKATGFDNISQKLPQPGSDIICILLTVTDLINPSITTSSFPDMLK